MSGAVVAGAEADARGAAVEPAAARTPSPARASRPSLGSSPHGIRTPTKLAAPARHEPSDLLASIERLKQEQKELKAHRKRVCVELKNAEKRRKRLRQRARQLSDADLVQVLRMRQAATASTDGKAEGADAETEEQPIAAAAGGDDAGSPRRSDSDAER